jgi:DpnII restriction endonuclease
LEGIPTSGALPWHIKASRSRIEQLVLSGFEGGLFRVKDDRGAQLVEEARERLRALRRGEAKTVKWQSPESPLPVPRILRKLIERFASVAAHLGKARRSEGATFVIRDEYDAQHLLAALLLTWFTDVRPEEPTPSTGLKSARMDLLIDDARVAVEVKRVRDEAHAAKVQEELMLDRSYYAKHPTVRSLWCLVYDPEKHMGMRAASLDRDLTNEFSDGGKTIDVHVVVSPRS